MLRILCPVCPREQRTTSTGKQIVVGYDLNISETNYSGLDVDIADCPNCGKTFYVAYKKEIESITEV